MDKDGTQIECRRGPTVERYCGIVFAVVDVFKGHSVRDSIDVEGDGAVDEDLLADVVLLKLEGWITRLDRRSEGVVQLRRLGQIEEHADDGAGSKGDSVCGSAATMHRVSIRVSETVAILIETDGALILG